MKFARRFMSRMNLETQFTSSTQRAQNAILYTPTHYYTFSCVCTLFFIEIDHRNCVRQYVLQ